MRKPFEPLQYPLSEVRLSDSVVLIEDANTAIAQDSAEYHRLKTEQSEDWAWQEIERWKSDYDFVVKQRNTFKVQLTEAMIIIKELLDYKEITPQPFMKFTAAAHTARTFLTKYNRDKK